MTFTGPIPQPTGPTSKAKLDWEAYIRERNAVRQALYAGQNTTRQQANLLLHQLSNASLMAGVQDGWGVVYDVGQGQYWPKPVLAEMTFHLQGDVATTTSPPWHSRYGATIVAVACDLGVYGSGDVEFDLLVDSSSVQSFSFSAQSSGRLTVDSPQPQIVAYTDLVQIEVTAAGSGCSDLVVHVELGVTSGLTTT